MTLLLKIAAIPLYPVGLSITLLIVGSIFIVRRRMKIGTIFALAALACMILFSSTFVSRALMRGLETQYEQKTDYPQVSAIVLLTGSPQPPIPPRHYVEAGAAADRMLHAVRLLKQGKAPVLVITGTCASCIGKRTDTEASLTKQLISELCSAKDEQIVLEEQARTTREHGIYCKKLFEDHHWAKSVILVTSAYHMPRSVAIFKKQGFTVFPAPTDFHFDNTIIKSVYDFFPTSTALDLSTTALHEYYGMIGYRIFWKS
jgi:uncharacterized SAM-binding protein YcdF (DUF218 family)